MSGLLSSITGAIGGLFKNFLPSWGDPTPVPPEATEPPKPEEEPEPESDGESEYETADEEDVSSESESESDNESEPEEEDKIIFRRIEDPAPKRLVETRRISDQGLC